MSLDRELHDLRGELLRVRNRGHDNADAIAASNLRVQALEGRVSSLEETRTKYLPIVDRLDDEAIERRAIVREAARDASRWTGRAVAAVAIGGLVAQIVFGIVGHS